MTKIIGVDLGLAKMGIVSLQIHDDEIADVHSKLVTSVEGEMSDIGRFSYMCESACSVVREDSPEIVVCEFPFGTAGKGRVNVEIFGALRNFCFRKAIPFVPVAQTSLKKYATGGGKAQKGSMMVSLYKETGLELSEDETDAYWCAHLGYTIRYGSEVSYRKELVRDLKKKHLTLPF